MNRRLLLKGAIGVGAIGGAAGLARYALLAPPPTQRLASVDELAIELYESLPEDLKAHACIDYDHPLRQFHNRGVWTGGLNPHALSLDWETRRLVTDLFYAGLSEIGRTRVPNQFAIRFPGIHSMQFLISGDPRKGPYQIMLSGVHLNLRLGGNTREGAAFGGPQVYGDQRGNGRVGLPGNTYRYQMETAHRIFTAMTPAQRAAARVELAPPQTMIGVQGKEGRFDGVPIAELSIVNRRLARDLADGVLENYAEDDADYARQCLERNGGIDALHIADYDMDYQGGRRAGAGLSQIFRLEGPAAVFYFRGEPHLHAFVNLAIDGERPLSVGDWLADNPRTLEGESLRAFFEAAMLEQAEADLAYFPAFSLAGRLRKGPIRTGDVWVAESWMDSMSVVEIRGSELAPRLAERLRARGRTPQSSSIFRIATTAYVADYESRERLGRIASRSDAGLLRDVLIAQIRKRGFRGAA